MVAEITVRDRIRRASDGKRWSELKQQAQTPAGRKAFEGKYWKAMAAAAAGGFWELADRQRVEELAELLAVGAQGMEPFHAGKQVDADLESARRYAPLAKLRATVPNGDVAARAAAVAAERKRLGDEAERLNEAVAAAKRALEEATRKRDAVVADGMALEREGQRIAAAIREGRAVEGFLPDAAKMEIAAAVMR
ncbi:MAG: hypothetical protein ACM359_12200 [Bacillota bacterium]